MRHAESYKNVPHPEDWTAEQVDALTPRGKEQAREIERSLERKQLAAIVSSPAKRARQTAEIIALAPGRHDVLVDSDLAQLKEGEALERGIARAMRAIEKLSREYAGRAVVIVLHGDICAGLISEAEGTGVGRPNMNDKPPGSVTELAYQNGRLEAPALKL